MSEIDKYIIEIPFKSNPKIKSYLNEYMFYVEHPQFETLNKHIRENYLSVTDRIFVNLSTSFLESEEDKLIGRLKILELKLGNDIEKIISEKERKTLKALLYKYPRLNKEDIYRALKLNNDPLQLISSLLKQKINYVGGGFVDFSYSTNKIIYFTSNNPAYLKEFLSNYFEDNYLFDLGVEEEEDDLLPLDDETQAYLENIKETLYKLQKKGIILRVLPIIEKYIEENSAEPDELSQLIITDDYKIILKDYNQMEIKMSHLTKAVFFLFLRYQKKGILLNELSKYEKELLEIYKKISNRNDYEAIKKSVKDIVTPGTNAIHMHLSRIKSAFTKKIHPVIAKNYYVTGKKNAPKKIILPSQYIDHKVWWLLDDDMHRNFKKFLEDEEF